MMMIYFYDLVYKKDKQPESLTQPLCSAEAEDDRPELQTCFTTSSIGAVYWKFYVHKHKF